MKTLEITNYGWWSVFKTSNSRLHNILSRHYCLEEKSFGKYVLCSVFGTDYEQFKGIRILQTSENICPDFNRFDYAIGFEYLDFNDRYIRMPNWIMNLKYSNDLLSMKNRHLFSDHIVKENREFCSFVYSNSGADKIRERIYNTLLSYKRVNSGGKYLNNIGGPVKDKNEFEKKHKFSIAFENSSHAGYTTEKIVQAFANGTIPIYWGDPEIGTVFNEKAFINAMNYPNIDDLVDRIIEVDTDNNLYYQMLNQPVLINPNYVEESINKLEKFLLNIFEQAYESCYRRNIK